jgi:hypothetical protein
MINLTPLLKFGLVTHHVGPHILALSPWLYFRWNPGLFCNIHHQLDTVIRARVPHPVQYPVVDLGKCGSVEGRDSGTEDLHSTSSEEQS